MILITKQLPSKTTKAPHQAGALGGATLRNFSVSVTAGTKLLGRHYIAPTYRSPAEPFIYAASQPMVVTVLKGNVLSLGSVSIGGTFDVACGLSGVKQKFQ